MSGFISFLLIIICLRPWWDTHYLHFHFHFHIYYWLLSFYHAIGFRLFLYATPSSIYAMPRAIWHYAISFRCRHCHSLLLSLSLSFLHYHWYATLSFHYRHYAADISFHFIISFHIAAMPLGVSLILRFTGQKISLRQYDGFNITDNI